jgi:hypothetical protein
MTTQVSENTFKFYQYQKGVGLPVFVRFDTASFGSDLEVALKGLKFSEVTEEEYQTTKKAEPKHCRILAMEEASPAVARQLSHISASDRYGAESIVARDGYRVYRHKAVAMVVYAFSAGEWSMGCHHNIAKNEREFRVVMNRFLSWALAPLGIVGFWGVPVEEGIVVMNQRESEGEVVFLNVRERRMFSIDGSERMKPRFRVIRLDSTLHQRNVNMNSTEVMAFLSATTVFLDTHGLSVGVRQMIQALSREVEGVIHPKESFKPRTDLSL